MDWTEQPVAIPQTFNELGVPVEDIFSGSIVVDHDNTSGFGGQDADTNPPLVAVYTNNNTVLNPQAPMIQAQSLTYSTDGGYTWEKYEGNPVLDRGSQNFRDPKVFWHEGDDGEGYWVMAVVEATDHEVLLYRSDDLEDWDYLSTFGPANAVGGVWECPDLFEVPVDGDPNNTRWVLSVNLNPGAVGGGSGGQYFVGDFDGTTFTADGEGERWLDWGRDYYAAVSYDNVPDDRRIMSAWMNNWDYALTSPGYPWRSAMSLPREVSLTDTGDRLELTQQVVDTVGDYQRDDEAVTIEDLSVPVGRQALDVSGDVLRLDLELEMGDADKAGNIVRQSDDGSQGTRIGYDARTGKMYVDRTASGLTGFSPKFASVSSAPVSPAAQVTPNGDGGTDTVTLQIHLDRSSVEVFSEDGTRTITDTIFPDTTSRGMSTFAEGGDATVRSLTVTPMGK